MSTDLKITELVETIEANAYVSGQTGQMSSKAHTYLRFREVLGIDFQSRLGAYLIDHILISILTYFFGFFNVGYLLVWYVGIKVLYFSKFNAITYLIVCHIPCSLKNFHCTCGRA